MGNNNAPAMFTDQAPEHAVTVSSFAMGATEVTNDLFVEFLNQVATQNLLYVQEGVPEDWANGWLSIANGASWNILADSTLSKD